MKRESNSMTRETEQEFERRMEALFSEIFPQHAQCGDDRPFIVLRWGTPQI